MKHLDILKTPRSLFLCIEWFISNHYIKLHFPIVASCLQGAYSSQVSSHAMSHTVWSEEKLHWIMGDVIHVSILSSESGF